MTRPLRSEPASPAPAIGFTERLQTLLPKLVLSPTVVLVLVFVYGFIAFTGYLSFTGSRILPSFELVGIDNYVRLFSLRNWSIALKNLAIFGVLYIAVCTVIGLFLAILLDQKIRGEGVLRPIYLYPMALSFIVTGTAWKWFLDPGIGLQNTMHLWGWESFEFTWIKDRNMAIYTIVIAAVWQSSGFVMAMFLAGLRGIDNEILKAAQIDGASNFQLYRRIVIPAAPSGLPLRLRGARPPRHQELRPGGGADRRRARPGHRDARHLHVLLHLHPEPDGGRRLVGGDHARHDRVGHRSLHLRRDPPG